MLWTKIFLPVKVFVLTFEKSEECMCSCWFFCSDQFNKIESTNCFLRQLIVFFKLDYTIQIFDNISPKFIVPKFCQGLIYQYIRKHWREFGTFRSSPWFEQSLLSIVWLAVDPKTKFSRDCGKHVSHNEPQFLLFFWLLVLSIGWVAKVFP